MARIWPAESELVLNGSILGIGTECELEHECEQVGCLSFFHICLYHLILLLHKNFQFVSYIL